MDSTRRGDGLTESYAVWRSSRLGRITDALEQDLLFELLGPVADKTLLDVGCGDGALAAELARRGALTTGLDSEPAMIAAARRRAEVGAHLQLVQGHAETLPFEDASFDRVVAVTVLCFVKEAGRAVDEMARVLKPGGRLVIGELGRWSLWAACRRIRGWTGHPTWRAARFRTARELRGLAETAGLAMVHVRGGVHYPPWGMAAQLLAPVDRWLGRTSTLGAAFIAVSATKRVEQAIARSSLALGEAPAMSEPRRPTPPILAGKDYDAPSEFTPESLLREARRQKGLPSATVPAICVLDPDGDLVRRLDEEGRVERDRNWACYHSELYRFAEAGIELGIVGRAVGAAYAVLVAEQLFVCGCRFLVSMTSAGQLAPLRPPPYFILIDRALRDEGTSYHYAPPAEFSAASDALLDAMQGAFDHLRIAVLRGAVWTTDAPFRETAGAIAVMRKRGLLAVEMEAAALYAFATARSKPVLCFAHVTNQMGRVEGDFEKGEADGTVDALAVIVAAARRFGRHEEA